MCVQLLSGLPGHHPSAHYCLLNQVGYGRQRFLAEAGPLPLAAEYLTPGGHRTRRSAEHSISIAKLISRHTVTYMENVCLDTLSLEVHIHDNEA